VIALIDVALAEISDPRLGQVPVNGRKLLGKPLEPFQPLPEFKYEDFRVGTNRATASFSRAYRLKMVESRMKALSN